MPAKIIEVDVTLLHATEKAYLFATGELDENGKDKGVWIAKSQCDYDGEGVVQMPEWMAKSKGLI